MLEKAAPEGTAISSVKHGSISVDDGGG
jgi:hypothetical protein